MSITVADAQTYIAKVYGGSSDDTIKAQALDALKAAMEFWSIKHKWHFLLQDTTQSFSVASCTTTLNSTTVTATSPALANVLQGMTVTGTGIPAGTTVASVTNNGSIELSAQATANGTVTLTFGGTIPIIAGTDTYLLPTKFDKPYSARLVSNLKYPLKYIQQNLLDAVTYDQTIQGYTTHYTIFNPTDFDASGTQQAKIKLWRPPQVADVLLLRYYRPFDSSKTGTAKVDCSDKYLYTLLDCAGIFLLRVKDSTSSRLPVLLVDMFGNGRDQRGRFQAAVADDKNEGGEDQDDRFIPIDELRPQGLGFSGMFYPDGDR